MKTKRLIGLALAALLCTAAFSGCNDNAAQSSSEGTGGSAASTEASTPEGNSGKFTAWVYACQLLRLANMSIILRHSQRNTLNLMRKSR